MRFIIMPFSLALLGGCATLPGDVYIQESKATGTKVVRLEPAGVWNSQIKLGLAKSLNTPGDDVILTAVVLEADNIEAKESLIINIDGAVTKLSPIDTVTRIETIPGGQGVSAWNESSRQYAVKEEFLKKMIEGQNVFVRLNSAKGFYEGEFRGGFVSAKSGFEKFLAEIIKQRGGPTAAK